MQEVIKSRVALAGSDPSLSNVKSRAHKITPKQSVLDFSHKRGKAMKLIVAIVTISILAAYGVLLKTLQTHDAYGTIWLLIAGTLALAYYFDKRDKANADQLRSLLRPSAVLDLHPEPEWPAGSEQRRALQAPSPMPSEFQNTQPQPGQSDQRH